MRRGSGGAAEWRRKVNRQGGTCLGPIPATEHDGREMSAEGDRELDCVFKGLKSADKGYTVQIAFRVGVGEVEGRRGEPVSERQCG
jgi:hypothetical protein